MALHGPNHGQVCRGLGPAAKAGPASGRGTDSREPRAGNHGVAQSPAGAACPAGAVCRSPWGMHTRDNSPCGLHMTSSDCGRLSCLPSRPQPGAQWASLQGPESRLGNPGVPLPTPIPCCPRGHSQATDHCLPTLMLPRSRELGEVMVTQVSWYPQESAYCRLSSCLLSRLVPKLPISCCSGATDVPTQRDPGQASSVPTQWRFPQAGQPCSWGPGATGQPALPPCPCRRPVAEMGATPGLHHFGP